jgi:hypothetical protein
MINSQATTANKNDSDMEEDEDINEPKQSSTKVTRIQIQAYFFDGYNKRVNSLAEYIQINREAIEIMTRNPVFVVAENNDKMLEMPSEHNQRRRPTTNILPAEADISNLVSFRKSVIGKTAVSVET